MAKTVELETTELSTSLQETYDQRLEALLSEREALRQRLALIEDRANTLESLASVNEDIAEVATRSLKEVDDVLEMNQISLNEIQFLAQSRATSNPEVVFESLPKYLQVTFAGFDRDIPETAELALSRLRPGSMELLEVYGIATFGEPDDDGCMEVALNDRVWELADVAKGRLE